MAANANLKRDTQKKLTEVEDRIAESTRQIAALRAEMFDWQSSGDRECAASVANDIRHLQETREKDTKFAEFLRAMLADWNGHTAIIKRSFSSVLATIHEDTDRAILHRILA